jgi:hypothetical protein
MGNSPSTRRRSDLAWRLLAASALAAACSSLACSRASLSLCVLAAAPRSVCLLFLPSTADGESLRLELEDMEPVRWRLRTCLEL